MADEGEIITVPEKQMIKLKLINGTTDEPDPNQPEKFYKLRFDTYMLPLDLSDYRFSSSMDKKKKEMSIRELIDEDRYLKKMGWR